MGCISTKATSAAAGDTAPTRAGRAGAGGTTGLIGASSSRALEQDYEVFWDNVLGKGHYGMVYKGRHRASGREVAVKVLDRSKSRKERLRLEVEILRRIGRHPNLVELLDAYETPTAVQLVFELMAGELYERLSNQGPYEEWEAALITKKLTEAVRYLHKRGIVHRDIKPENLLLTSKTGRAEVKLCDFGLAKLFTTEQAEAATQGVPYDYMRTVCGTWAYSAPEVRIYRQPYTHKVDLWSLGVIVYVLLSGYHPFDPEGNAGEDELQENIRRCEYDFNDPVWTSVSDAAKDLIRRLLVLDPLRRIDTGTVLKHPWLQMWAHTWPATAFAGDSSGAQADGVVSHVTRVAHTEQEHATITIETLGNVVATPANARTSSKPSIRSAFPSLRPAAHVQSAEGSPQNDMQDQPSRGALDGLSKPGARGSSGATAAGTHEHLAGGSRASTRRRATPSSAPRHEAGSSAATHLDASGAHDVEHAADARSDVAGLAGGSNSVSMPDLIGTEGYASSRKRDKEDGVRRSGRVDLSAQAAVEREAATHGSRARMRVPGDSREHDVQTRFVGENMAEQHGHEARMRATSRTSRRSTDDAGSAISAAAAVAVPFRDDAVATAQRLDRPTVHRPQRVGDEQRHQHGAGEARHQPVVPAVPALTTAAESGRQNSARARPPSIRGQALAIPSTDSTFGPTSARSTRIPRSPHARVQQVPSTPSMVGVNVLPTPRSPRDGAHAALRDPGHTAATHTSAAKDTAAASTGLATTSSSRNHAQPGAVSRGAAAAQTAPQHKHASGSSRALTAAPQRHPRDMEARVDSSGSADSNFAVLPHEGGFARDAARAPSATHVAPALFSPAGAVLLRASDEEGSPDSPRRAPAPSGLDAPKPDRHASRGARLDRRLESVSKRSLTAREKALRDDRTEVEADHSDLYAEPVVTTRSILPPPLHRSGSSRRHVAGYVVAPARPVAHDDDTVDVQGAAAAPANPLDYSREPDTRGTGALSARSRNSERRMHAAARPAQNEADAMRRSHRVLLEP